MPWEAALPVTILAILLQLHIINTFSAMGRVIMHTGAMSDLPILDPEEEEKRKPSELSELLIKRTQLSRKVNVPIDGQYTIDYQLLLRDAAEGKVSFPIRRAEVDRRASQMTLMKKQSGAKNLDYRISSFIDSITSSDIKRIEENEDEEEIVPIDTFEQVETISEEEEDQ